MSADWRPEGQRIPPLEPDQWDERARKVLSPTRELLEAAKEAQMKVSPTKNGDRP